jgi:cytochrome c5
MSRKTLSIPMLIGLAMISNAGSSFATEQASSERLEEGWKVFKRTCTVCHLPGVGGAPAIGNRAAWKDRIEAGTARLYQHAISGFNGASGKRMPARGGNWNLTDEQVRAAVDYMIHNSQ